MKRFLLGALLAFVLVTQACAQGFKLEIQTQCYPRVVLVELLIKEFGETQAWRATIEDPRFILEKFSNLKARTYTLFITSVDGESCVLYMGTNEEFFFPPGPSSNAIKD